MPRTLPRAVQALALLLGFYVLSLGVLAAVVAANVALTLVWLRTGGPAPTLVWGVGVLLGYPVVCGLITAHGGGRRRRDGRDGVPVSPEEQPELWRRVRAVAAAVGTRPPAELRLTDGVRAAVRQDSWLLGLVPGRRELLLGLPLLAGLTTAELDAVLAHELGHYGHFDTRLAPLTARNRAGLHRILLRYAQSRGIGRGIGQLFARYAEFCLRVSLPVARAQELAADRVSARVAGRTATASALRQVRALGAAYARYRAEQVDSGLALGLRPPAEDVLPGFRRFLATGAWREEAQRLLDDPPRERVSPYDSHPPIEERLARIEALPEEAAPLDAQRPADGPAFGLLREPATPTRRILAAGAGAGAGAAGAGAGAGAAGAGAGAAQQRELPWDALADAVGQAELLAEAEPLRRSAHAVLRRRDDLESILDAVDAGRWAELVEWMPRKGTTPGMSVSASGTAASDALYSLVLRSLVERGRGRWRMDAARGRVLELDEGIDPALGPAVDAATDASAPDTGPLRRLLASDGTTGAAAATSAGPTRTARSVTARSEPPR